MEQAAIYDYSSLCNKVVNGKLGRMQFKLPQRRAGALVAYQVFVVLAKIELEARTRSERRCRLHIHTGRLSSAGLLGSIPRLYRYPKRMKIIVHHSQIKFKRFSAL